MIPVAEAPTENSTLPAKQIAEAFKVFFPCFSSA
jgi:hypothetical protein